ncbi:MAG: DUF192 domain-containing protein [Cyanobacteria bacterium SZAS LIN-2]|nr:DUF192 domain-containing protein [Cyanobacteria bacterium SZAS LIN-3]MBS1996601.1 DUF192 domain-containing protein [Cyanobacteria bacterium SZAS LIN-2]
MPQPKIKSRYLRFVNSTRDKVLAERAFNANNLFTRFRGLLGTSNLPAGEGMFLDPCNGIHMFWMTYAIDAVFIDEQLQVVALVEKLPPWAVSKVYKTAKTCLELPVGTISATGTVVGDVLSVEAASA